MIANRPTVVVYDNRVLWHLAAGTKLREIGFRGRTFTSDGHIPGRVWLGNVPCAIHVVELPVEVLGVDNRPTTSEGETAPCSKV